MPFSRARAPLLGSGGFALLALGGIMGVLGLTAAELENVGQATAWSTGAFASGVLGAIFVGLGAASKGAAP